MPFYRINGMGVVHMKGTKLPKPCGAVVGIGERQHVCADLSEFLCDWPAGGGRTCDRALCAAHALEVARNRHYCPEHFAEHTGFEVQRGLFTHLVDGGAS